MARILVPIDITKPSGPFLTKEEEKLETAIEQESVAQVAPAQQEARGKQRRLIPIGETEIPTRKEERIEITPKIDIPTIKKASKLISNTTNALQDFANQISFGAQETLIKLGDIIGAIEPEEAKRKLQELPEPKTGIGGIGRTVGEFTTPIPGAKQVQGAVVLGNVPKIAATTRKIANIASKVKKAPGEVIEKIGRALTALGGRGYNEKVPALLKEFPETIFEPKATWQRTFNQVGNFLKNQKNVIGKQLGELKSKLSKEAQNLNIPTKLITDELRKLSLEIPPTARAQKRAIDRFINLANSGGKKITKKADIKKARIAGTKDDPLTRLALGFPPLKKPVLTIDGISKVLEAISSDASYNQIINRTLKGEKITNAERLVLGAYDVVKKRFANLLNQVDNEALTQGLTKAKGQYANLVNKEKLIGGVRGLSPKDLPKRLQQSLTVNNENQFDALRTILPDRLMKKFIGVVLNQSTQKITTAVAPLATQATRARTILGSITEAAEKAGGAIAGELPAFPIGGLPTKVIKGRKALGAGIEKVSRSIIKGLGTVPRAAKRFPLGVGVQTVNGEGPEEF